MILVGSAMKGVAIEATDGLLGHVADFLFDDRNWKIRWMVVETGGWLQQRKVLIQPSVIAHPDDQRDRIFVRLTREQVEASPDIGTDQPVSMQMENSVYGHYGWDPLWGGAGFFGGYPYAMGLPLASAIYDPNRHVSEETRADRDITSGNPHLRSMASVTGYDIQATDGAIGHLENVLVDEATWTIRYLIIDTKNWWPGQHVLLSPFAVREINWAGNELFLDVSRDKVKGSPAWSPLDIIDNITEQRMHSYYGWSENPGAMT